ADAVLPGQEAGEQRRVGRKRQRRRRVGVREEDRVAAQRVQVRRLDPLVAVCRQVVRAQGVDGDQDDGRAGGDIGGGGGAGAGDGEQQDGSQHRRTPG